MTRTIQHELRNATINRTAPWIGTEFPTPELASAAFADIRNNDRIELLEISYEWREEMYPISGKQMARIPDSRQERVLEARTFKAVRQPKTGSARFRNHQHGEWRQQWPPSKKSATTASPATGRCT